MVAIVTPMHDDGSLDLDAFRKLIDWHIEEGTDAIVVVGTTGESPTVDFDEHHQLIKLAVEHSHGRIPVIAVTGTNGKTTTVRLIAHILARNKLRVGMTSTDGVYIEGQRIEAERAAQQWQANAGRLREATENERLAQLRYEVGAVARADRRALRAVQEEANRMVQDAVGELREALRAARAAVVGLASSGKAPRAARRSGAARSLRVLVADDGSSDGTARIAAEHGARVVSHPWEGFGPQKNYALSLAAGLM